MMTADPTTLVLVGVVAINAVAMLVNQFVGGNGQKGVIERVAVVERDVKHIRNDMNDLKRHWGLTHRFEDE